MTIRFGKLVFDVSHRINAIAVTVLSLVVVYFEFIIVLFQDLVIAFPFRTFNVEGIALPLPSFHNNIHQHRAAIQA